MKLKINNSFITRAYRIKSIRRGIEMEILQGVIGVLILIIIGMLFGRIMRIAGLIVEAIIKLFRKLF